MKKFLSCMLSLVMALSLAVPAFAAEGAVPMSTDHADVTVDGLNPKDTVKLYKLIGAEYNEHGFVQYIWNSSALNVTSEGIDKAATGSTPVKFGNTVETTLDGATAEDGSTARLEINGLTVENVAKWAAASGSLESAKVLDENGAETAAEVSAVVAETATIGEGSVSIPVNAGTYLVVVTPGEAKPDMLYNPMIVSCYYTTGGSNPGMGAGSVDAGSNWNLYGDKAYSKKTDMTMEKTIVDGETAEGDSLGIGDDVQFKVEAVIPAYGNGYDPAKIKVSFTDTMDAGLTYNNDLAVNYGGENVDFGAWSTLSTEDINGFVLTLDGDWVMDQASKDAGSRKIILTYSAKLNDQATGNADYNRNNMVYEWSNNPNNYEETGKLTDRTYTYTFDVNGSILGNKIIKTEEGQYPGFQNITNLLVKVAAGENKLITDKDVVKWGKTTWTEGQLKDVDITDSIAGKVVFNLYKVENDADFDSKTIADPDDIYKTGTNDSLGLITFIHLPEGKYLFKEATAPDGFSLSDEVHTLFIDATYFEKGDADIGDAEPGMLKSVTFEIDGQSNTFSFSYTKTENSDPDAPTFNGVINLNETTIDQTNTNVAQVMNTRMGALPSTGGIGTTVFIAGGIIAMAIAAFVLMAVRKRKNED